MVQEYTVFCPYPAYPLPMAEGGLLATNTSKKAAPKIRGGQYKSIHTFATAANMVKVAVRKDGYRAVGADDGVAFSSITPTPVSSSLSAVLSILVSVIE